MPTSTLLGCINKVFWLLQANVYVFDNPSSDIAQFSTVFPGSGRLAVSLRFFPNFGDEPLPKEPWLVALFDVIPPLPDKAELTQVNFLVSVAGTLGVLSLSGKRHLKPNTRPFGNFLGIRRIGKLVYS